MCILDDKIAGNIITYRERIELIIADNRGKVDLSNFADELELVENGMKYADERKRFWLDWNKEYKRVYKKMDTQERYIAAQQISSVYENAVYKTLLVLICSELLSSDFSSNFSIENSIEKLQELLWTYMAGSLYMMKFPLKTIQKIIEIVKKNNDFLGISFEKKFNSLDNKSIKAWIKQA